MKIGRNIPPSTKIFHEAQTHFMKECNFEKKETKKEKRVNSLLITQKYLKFNKTKKTTYFSVLFIFFS